MRPEPERYDAAIAFARSIGDGHLRLHDDGLIELGLPGSLDNSLLEELRYHITAFAPWRKGPFLLFGERIDANWRSEEKWFRLAPHLGDLRGRRIADVGCNNGYYLWQLSRLGAGQRGEDGRIGALYGLDPMPLFARSYDFLTAIAPLPGQIEFRQLGFSDLAALVTPVQGGRFETILCMGLLYHRRDPFELLFTLHESLEPRGELYLETLLLPEWYGLDDRAVELRPAGRYLGMKGVWGIVSDAAMHNLAKRINFRSCELLSRKLDISEQLRQLPYGNLPGLPELTTTAPPAEERERFAAAVTSGESGLLWSVEGYPAAERAIYRLIR